MFIVKKITNYLISHSDVMDCNHCKNQMIEPTICATCNKNTRSNFIADEATRLLYEFRAKDIIKIISDNIN